MRMKVKVENDPITFFQHLSNFLLNGMDSLTELMKKYCFEGWGSK